MIHIQGLGLIGSFIADALDRRSIPFTWTDWNAPFTAWEACTGSISPLPDSSQDYRALGYRFWRDYARAFPTLVKHLEPVTAIHVQAGKPASFDAAKPEKIGGNKIWRDARPSFQFAAGEFVMETRRRFAAQRRPRPEPRQGIIFARGVLEPEIRPIVVWGWRCGVTLIRTNGSRLWYNLTPRPAIHFNDTKRTYERYYFYPRAGCISEWWAGSETVLQKTPTENPERALEGLRRFKQTVTDRFAGEFEVSYYESTLTEGWRPKPRKAHSLRAHPYFSVGPNVVIQPMYKSGVQSGPMLAAAVAEKVIG